MVSLSVLIGWIWRHLLESDRLPFPTVSFLLPETLSRLSCDSSLILEPATMMKEAWYSKVCIQCHPCLIIGYLVLYFGLLSSVSRFICCNNYFASFDKSMTLFCRHFLGIFSLVIWKPRDSWKYFQEFVIAIASIAFSNGATNWIRISLSFVFVYSVCIIIVGFFFLVFFLLHMCATWWGLVNIQGPCDHLMVHFLSGFTFIPFQVQLCWKWLEIQNGM